jgi:alpha,alpha-trehalose-phosphate synthase [UDP-forming]
MGFTGKGIVAILKSAPERATNNRMHWTEDYLQQLVRERLGQFRFIAVSNREPYIHSHVGGAIECMRPASGLTTAIDPIMRATNGTWVAHGSGSADREVVDGLSRVRVPHDAPSYTLRRVWLSKELMSGYCFGMANEGLWPLCHTVFHQPRFRPADWAAYRRANELFADAVLEETQGQRAFVFIQDYHLALLPRILRRRNPNLVIAQFWHIPWPSCEALRVFPWREELIDGLLGNDLLAFQLPYHCSKFLDTTDRHIEALVSQDNCTVQRDRHITSVRAFPISIDFEAHARAASSSAVEKRQRAWYDQLGSQPEFLGIGIDRVDYTKGIPERLNAVDRFLDAHPSFRKRFVFVQIGVPSRTDVPAYRELIDRIQLQVDSINAKWQTGDWRPIRFLKQHFDQESMIALHRIADFCLVSSLHDGMNLVAKEFVASRDDEDGCLILSSFTGSARELTDALLVNPFAPHEIANAIYQAVSMEPAERRDRMSRMRTAVRSRNVYRWGADIVEAIADLRVSSRDAVLGESETSMGQVA